MKSSSRGKIAMYYPSIFTDVLSKSTKPSVKLSMFRTRFESRIFRMQFRSFAARAIFFHLFRFISTVFRLDKNVMEQQREITK
jgi:hypothetical protein